MYKLVIVDDEEEVRKGIIQKIPWSHYNFEIAGEAENGREALDLIEENIPDAVLTDIAMPLMDGLQLAGILHENYPTVKIIILTGYDDFKFAQKAIKYGVSDYILKPVMPRDIGELMEKLRTRIEDEIARKEDMKKLRDHYLNSLPVIKEKFLTSLVTSRSDMDEVLRKISYFNLSISGDRFIVAAAAIDSISFKYKIFEEDDIELLKFAVLNISREIVANHAFGEVFFHDDNLVVIGSFAGCPKSEMLNRSFLVLEEIRQNTEKYLKATITIGLGNLCDSIVMLKDSYKSALSAIEYRMVIGYNRVIYIEDLEPNSAGRLIFDENKERELVSGIKFGTAVEVSEAVSALFREITGVKASFKEYQLYLIEILAAISRISRDIQLDTGDLLEPNSNLFTEIFKFDTLDEIKNWIEKICISLMNHISSRRQNTTRMLLDRAKSYIRRNFSDDELSIQKLADNLHISPVYLSMIFKKEAGETFLRFLVRVRLEAAQELLGNSDLKISEIAEKIGVPDINYFSYFFKKNFGMSPREYRNKMMEKGS